MQLNAECVRDVLLALEKHLQVDFRGQIEPYCSSDLEELPELSQYSPAEIHYTIRLLEDGGFIAPRSDTMDPAYRWFLGEHGITYKGHEFINSIRPQPVWQVVLKRLAKAGGSASISVLAALAEEAAKRRLFGSGEP